MANKETYIIEQKLTTDNSSLISGNKKAKTSTSELGGAVSGVTSKMKGLINPTNLVASAVGVLTYKTVQAVKNFAAYEKQMSSVNTLLKVSRSELSEYGNGLIDIAVKVGTTKEELASGAYEALSAGVESTELLGFMETAAKGATAGMTDVTTSTDVLTSTINGFKLETSDANDVMDKLITIQNEGKIVLGEMSTVMGDVADISNSLGVDLDNVGAALSTITSSGTPAAQAGTRIKAMFSELAKEGTDASGVFEEITGKSFKEFIAEGGNVGEALQEMEKYAKSNGKQMIDLWSSIEAGQGAMGLTGKNATSFTKNLDKMKDSAGELETAYTLASDNVDTLWEKLTSSIAGQWQDMVDSNESALKKSLKALLTFSEKTREIMKNDVLSAENVEKTRLIGLGLMDAPVVQQDSAEDVKNEQLSTRNYLSQSSNSESQNNNSNSGGKTDKELEKERKEHLEKLAAYESSYANEINLIDIGILEKKRAYYEDLNSQLEAGQISKEEYDKLAAAYDESSQAEQDNQYIEALEKLKAFYLKMGEVAKANEIEKQILEIEVETNINVGENYEEDTALKEFLASQLEAEKEFKSQMAELEANFQYEMLTLKSQGEITDSEFAQKEKDHQENLITMTKQHDIDMLEEKRNFYALQKQDMETALEIEAEIIEKKKELKETEEKNDKEELSWRQTYEDFKQDITGMAETATKSAYRDAIENEENFAVALKSAMQEQLKEWLLVKGEEMAWKSLYQGAEALAALAHGDMAGFTTHTASALEYAAQATAFGVAASALSTSSSSSDSDDDDDYDYDDDEDVSTTEDTASDSDDDSPTIYVSTDDNAMAKAMVQLLEDELNDEYNVSIIGKKK